MAYLTKEQYEHRERSAERRNADNEEIAVSNGMTEEQAELISDLCRLRHELHTNIAKVAINDSDSQIKTQLVELNARIVESGLEPMDFIPVDTCDYIDIDDINELSILEKWPESGTQEYQDKYDDEYDRIYGELENLNKDIEKYLAGIDKRYGTTWEPTGTLRIM